MTIRRELEHRRLEIRMSLVAWLANRAFTRSTRGLDGLAKRLLAKKVPPVAHDPDLDHEDVAAPGRG